jgi:small subunit ribosomal protein S17
MQKTAVVRVDRVVVHPKYRKRYKISKKFLVHDPENKAKVGTQVTIKETRPISKTKRWILVSDVVVTK